MRQSGVLESMEKMDLIQAFNNLATTQQLLALKDNELTDKQQILAVERKAKAKEKTRADAALKENAALKKQLQALTKAKKK